MKPFIFFAIIISALSNQSCKRGVDDPELSLRSRKSRITGEWMLARIERNKKPEIPRKTDEFLTLNDDGTGEKETIYDYDGFGHQQPPFIEKIHWEFNKKTKTTKGKDSIIINDLKYHIRELHNDKMVIETSWDTFSFKAIYYKNIAK